MDLKIEILESYSRIHGRLLEQEDDGHAAANSLINAGRGAQSPMHQPSTAQAPSGKTVGVFLKKDGVAKGGITGPDGLVLGGRNQYNLDTPEGLAMFVKLFSMEGDNQSSTEEDGEQGGQPQEPVMPPQPGDITRMANLSDETKGKTALNFVSVAGRSQTLWSDLSEELQSTFGSINAFSDFLTGPASTSFERQLVSDKFVLKLVDGNWTATQEPPQEAQTSLISDAFRDLIDTVADGKCSNGDVLSDFATTDTGDVLVSPKGDQDDRSEALAFRDKTGFLKMLINKASVICNKEIQRKAKLRTSHTSNPGGDNAIRGFAFEDILETVSLLRLISTLKKRGGNVSALERQVKKKTILINEKLSRLQLDNEVWVKAYEESGLDPNQVGMIRDIAEILQGGPLTNNLYASMLKHSNQSVKVRGSIYALPVGDQTGSGQRQDVLEIFATPEDAMEAAKRSGITGVVPLANKVEKLFQGSSKASLRALKSAGVFSPGQEVYALKVSLKNYMKLDHAVFGGGRFTTFHDMTSKSLEESTFAKNIASNIGIDEASYASFQEYTGGMEKIGNAIFDIPFNTNMLTSKGDKINQNTAKNFAEEVLTNLNTNHTFPELDGGEMRQLKSLAERVAKGNGTSHEDTAAYKKLQYTINSFLQHKKLQKDLANPDKNIRKQAQMFAAFKMFHAGGSDDDNLVCDYRGLKTEENYVFKQNDPLRDAWRSIMANDGAGDGEWTLKVTAGEPKETTKGKKKTFKSTQIKLVRKGEHLAVSNDLVPSKNSKGKVTNYNMNYNCQVNRALMKKYNTSKGILENKDLGEILSHIKLLFEKVAIIGIK